jgi:hypothetical protein
LAEQTSLAVSARSAESCVVRFKSESTSILASTLASRAAIFVLIGGPIGLLLLLLAAYLGLPFTTVYGLWRRDPAKYSEEEEEEGRWIQDRIHGLLGRLGSLSFVLGDVPFKDAREAVDLRPSASTPTKRSAFSRLFYGVPTMVGLVVSTTAGSIIWLVAVVWLLLWGSYPKVLYRTLLRSVCLAGDFACYQASLVDSRPRFSVRSEICVWEESLAILPPGEEARGFIKDWVTTLILTSGVLVTLVLAVLAVLHNSQKYSYWYLAVDIPAVLGMAYFLISILYGFRSLGNLVSGTARVQQSAGHEDYPAAVTEHLELSRTLAFRSLRIFLRGLTLVVITAVGVVLVFAAKKGG